MSPSDQKEYSSFLLNLKSISEIPFADSSLSYFYVYKKYSWVQYSQKVEHEDLTLSSKMECAGIDRKAKN